MLCLRLRGKGGRAIEYALALRLSLLFAALPVTLACVRGPRLRMLFALPALPLPVPRLNPVNQGINLHLTSFTWIGYLYSSATKWRKCCRGLPFWGVSFAHWAPYPCIIAPFGAYLQGPMTPPIPSKAYPHLPPLFTTQRHYLTPARTLDDPAISANLIFSACPAPRACSVH